MSTSPSLTTFIDSAPLSTLQIRVIVLCALVVLFDGMDTQVVGYLGPALSAEWDIPRNLLGPVFSASLVGLMVGLLALAPLADRWGRRNSILVSVFLFAGFTLVTTFARGVNDLILWRFLAGIGLGGAMPNALALTGEYCPKRLKSTLVILMFCGFSLGSILGGLVAATLLDTVGWRGVFMVGAVLPLLLLPVLYRYLPESLLFLSQQPAGHSRVQILLAKIAPGAAMPTMELPSGTAPAVPIQDLFREQRTTGTVLLWAVFFMNLMVFYFLQSWLPTLFTDAGLPAQNAVLMATLISVGGIVAGLITGPLMDRFSPYRVLAVLYLAGALWVAAIGIATPAALALVTFCAGFCVSGGQKSVNALAVIFYPTKVRSTGVGWALGIGRFGSILGPVVAGFLLNAGWNVKELMQLAAVPMLLAAVFIFIMGRYYTSGDY